MPWGDPAWYRAYNSPYITPSQCATPHACARLRTTKPKPGPFAYGSLAWRKKMRVFTEKEVMPFVHAWCAAAHWLRRGGRGGAATAAPQRQRCVDVDSPCAHFYRAPSRRDEAKSIPREFYKKAAAIGLLAASVVRVRGVAPSHSGGRNQF